MKKICGIEVAMQKLGILVVVIALVGLALIFFLRAGCRQDCETTYSFDNGAKQACIAKCSAGS